jgi:hypothetical protein
MNKRHILIIGIVLIAVAAGIAAFRGPNTDTEPAATSTPLAKKVKPLTIQEYIKQNISKLSPEKEVLGGKFYIVKIEAHGGTGTVIYEDGHNAFKADFTYEVDEAGNPSVTSFKIRK